MGMTDQEVGDRTGLHKTSVGKIRNGNRVMRRDTYDRIMALTPEPSSPPHETARRYGAHIPDTGVVRRLQALTAVGFSSVLLGRLMGFTQKYVSMATRRPSGMCHASSQQTVAEWYAKLADADPLDYGESEVGKARAIARAKRHRYPHPGCWDAETIDDPDARPEWTGVCGTPEGPGVHRREGITICPACKAVRAEGGPAPFDPGRLRSLRREKRMTAPYLAALIGTSADSVYRWENGERTPRPAAVDRLANALQVPLSELEVRTNEATLHGS
ncbi:helix-turn-helix domain-containing protein [Streptomyces griseus]|uniref:helix-turn-helix domain-containing protein n=1 Tax=Streptomyces griseus TaxID=1911 RepID=UPI0033EA1EFC